MNMNHCWIGPYLYLTHGSIFHRKRIRFHIQKPLFTTPSPTVLDFAGSLKNVHVLKHLNICCWIISIYIFMGQIYQTAFKLNSMNIKCLPEQIQNVWSAGFAFANKFYKTSLCSLVSAGGSLASIGLYACCACKYII